MTRRRVRYATRDEPIAKVEVRIAYGHLFEIRRERKPVAPGLGLGQLGRRTRMADAVEGLNKQAASTGLQASVWKFCNSIC